jgi:hypothetical protein
MNIKDQRVCDEGESTLLKTCKRVAKALEALTVAN